ncbi:MAG: beta-propeller domain-containing protein, partial [Kineosporiaceae bacterium]
MSLPRLPLLLSAAGVSAVLAVGFALSGSGPGEDGTGAPDIRPVALTSFRDCPALLTHFRAQAHDLVGPYGLPGSAGSPGFGGQPPAVTRSVAAPEDRAGSAQGDGLTGATSQTGTNVQVAGVDEADLAKRSGDLLLVVGSGPAGDGVLRVLRTTGADAALLATLPTPGWVPTHLVVHGNTAVLSGAVTGPRTYPNVPRTVTGTGTLPGTGIRPEPRESPRTRLLQVDLADPARPRPVRTLDLDGTEAGARLVDGVLRVAVTSAPDNLGLVTPQDAGEASVQRALDTNRAAIAASDLDSWLPSYRLMDGAPAPGPGSDPAGGTGSGRTGRLVDCPAVDVPGTFAGLNTLALVSFDLRDPAGIGQWRSGAVVASGTTLYATADRTYLATPVPPKPGAPGPSPAPATAGTSTAIHAFATEGNAAPRYLASGSVPGTLLNQFAMDADGDDLRVASTTDPSGRPVRPGQPEEDGTAGDTPTASPDPGSGRITVLRQRGAVLTQVGTLSGLGAGERVRAVRFAGDLGYIVTFRQTDPLFTVDLSDPEHPRELGELELLGYSAYLHPLGAGRLLGVGQDADSGGRTTGLQLSLFDVGDPAAPRRVTQV